MEEEEDTRKAKKSQARGCVEVPPSPRQALHEGGGEGKEEEEEKEEEEVEDKDLEDYVDMLVPVSVLLPFLMTHDSLVALSISRCCSHLGV